MLKCGHAPRAGKPLAESKVSKMRQLLLEIVVGAQIKPDFSNFDAIFGVSEQLCTILRLDVLQICTLASGSVALWARSPLTVDNHVDHSHVH